MTADHHHVTVLEAGAPGEHRAAALAEGGLRVAVVERELLGGECSYWGCIPSKTLLRPGEVLAATRTVPGARETVTGTLDVASALAWRDFSTARSTSWSSPTGRTCAATASSSRRAGVPASTTTRGGSWRRTSSGAHARRTTRRSRG